MKISIYKLERMIDSAQLEVDMDSPNAFFGKTDVSNLISNNLAKANKDGIAAINKLGIKQIEQRIVREKEIRRYKGFLINAGSALDECQKDYERKRLELEIAYKKQVVEVDWIEQSEA